MSRKLSCIHASWQANKQAPRPHIHLLDAIRVVYLALNAAGVVVPSVLLVDVVLRFVFINFFLYKQTSTVAAANPAGEKLSERGAG